MQEARRAREEGERRKRERGHDRHSRYKDRYRGRYRHVCTHILVLLVFVILGFDFKNRGSRTCLIYTDKLFMVMQHNHGDYLDDDYHVSISFFLKYFMLKPF